MTASTPTQRWADDGIVANALHPGGIRTAYALDPAARTGSGRCPSSRCPAEHACRAPCLPGRGRAAVLRQLRLP